MGNVLKKLCVFTTTSFIIVNTILSIEVVPTLSTKDIVEVKSTETVKYRAVGNQLVFNHKPVQQEEEKRELVPMYLKESMIDCISGFGTEEPRLDSHGKMVFNSYREIYRLDIRKKSNWTREDFEQVLPDTADEIIDTALKMEQEIGVNAIYIAGVGCIETLYGREMAGRYNYFNWTVDAKSHFDFKSLKEFREYSIKRYKESFLNESFYSDKIGVTPNYINISIVNSKYAINNDLSTNWYWGEILGEVMMNMSNSRVASVGEGNNNASI